MERLVTTAQASQILGLSLQGIHYRIKRNQLKSIKKDGKTYVYISDYFDDRSNARIELEENSLNTFKEIIKAKDEQIDTLKTSIKWGKKQYNSEIYRLEKNQKRIIKVFNREIKLLQSAFNEMRTIYKPQILKNNEELMVEKKDKFISLQNLSLYFKQHNKSQEEIKNLILKAIEKNDSRFIYNKKDKKLLILNEDFSDLL